MNSGRGTSAMANNTENMTAIVETDTAVKAAPLSAIDYAVLRAADSYELYELVKASRSANTLRVYDFHWNKFSDFVLQNGKTNKSSTMSKAVAAYISKLVEEKKSVSYINQAVAAIRHNLELFGMVKELDNAHETIENPASSIFVKRALAGARRTLGTAPRHKKAAATTEVIKALVGGLDRSTLQGKRDAAIILLGFFGAFRRSELVALDVEDIEAIHTAAGRVALLFSVRKSKTDQEGAGMTKGIFPTQTRELDPVIAVLEYLHDAGIESGAIFRRIRRGGHIQPQRLTGESIRDIVAAAAKRAGVVLDLGAHSLRSGFITSALESGASERSIMNQSGHKSVTVMRSYQQRRDALADNAASGLAAAM